MKLASGIDLLTETEGAGRFAAKGDRIIFNTRMFLSKGEKVPLNEELAKRVPEGMIRRLEHDVFIDHRIVLGKREAIAGVEHSLLGMKEGGYRKVRVSPHLAYRDKGIPDLIPANAVLVIELWLRQIL